MVDHNPKVKEGFKTYGIDVKTVQDMIDPDLKDIIVSYIIKLTWCGQNRWISAL